jgi:hypothetical protein
MNKETTLRMAYDMMDFATARKNFMETKTSLNCMLDILMTQKIITKDTAAYLNTKLQGLEYWCNEIEIALRKELKKETTNDK